MKKKSQNAEQTREAINKFFARSHCESPIDSNYSPPLNTLIFEMWMEVLRLERRLRAQLFFTHKSKEGQRKHRRKISAYFNRALYGKEDLTESDRNKLSACEHGGKLASLLRYFLVSPYKAMTVREQAAIFGGPVGPRLVEKEGREHIKVKHGPFQSAPAEKP